VRPSTSLGFAGNVAFVLSMALSGCDRNDPAEAARARAEIKRQRAACASPSAIDRLKNSIFDEAISARQGDRTNLDVLADYSVVRLQDPVVKGWDRKLDIIRCESRFILEVPPGAERAFAGERQLLADIEYTAQASADGAGFVYQQRGAEPIVGKLAAFNLAAATYRPPPAIDEPAATTEISEQITVAEKARPRALSTANKPSPPVNRETSVPSAPSATRLRGRIADMGSTAPNAPVLPRTRVGNAEATVRAFYGALAAGNGAAASLQVISEKRSRGAFSPGAMSRFYGRLPERIKLTSIVPVAGGGYRVTYRYSAGRSRCNGSAVVTLTNRGGHHLIRSIRSLSGC
jgi:hypothetical protein